MALGLEQVRRALRRLDAGVAGGQRGFEVTPVDGSPAYLQAAPPPGVAPRPAAVLIPIFETGGEARLLLIRRDERLAAHAGQVGFPGGSREPGDGSLRETALREAREELGLRVAGDQVLGALAPVYIPPSNFLVTPWVALLGERPVVTADGREVAEVLEHPVELLLGPGRVESEEWTLRGHRYRVPFYRVGPHKVWGATARMLGMLARALEAGRDSAEG